MIRTGIRLLAVSAALLLAVLAAGCVAPLPRAGAPLAHPDFIYTYRAPESAALRPLHARLVELDLLGTLPEIQTIDALLALPEPVVISTAECGEPAALYYPDRREVVLCYEMLQALYQQGLDLAAQSGQGTTFAERYVAANLRFIVSHELGHVLIDLLDLPVTGRIEDAVDQFAALLMQVFAREGESVADVAWNLRMASHWFLVGSRGQYPLEAYADAHSLGEQRYFNLQCLLYGSDPVRFSDLVAGGDLPPARAGSCPAEARRAGRAWTRLLLPHVDPALRIDPDSALRQLERRFQSPGEPLRFR